MHRTKKQRILLLATILLSLFIVPQIHAAADDEFVEMFGM